MSAGQIVRCRMNKHKALETMCRRCINYEVCQATRCEPKKVLQQAIKESEEDGD